MTLYEVARAVDPNLPLWINEDGYSDRYENIAEALEYNKDLEVKYITLDGEGELTIETGRSSSEIIQANAEKLQERDERRRQW